MRTIATVSWLWGLEEVGTGDERGAAKDLFAGCDEGGGRTAEPGLLVSACERVDEVASDAAAMVHALGVDLETRARRTAAAAGLEAELSGVNDMMAVRCADDLRVTSREVRGYTRAWSIS